MSFSHVAQIYYFYYASFLYNLIHSFNCSFEWLDLNENIFINITGIHHKRNINNPFIDRQNKIALAEDILQNGLYFPFFILEDNNNYKQLLLGKHRLYSLLGLYHRKPFKKKFLFIKIPVKSLIELQFSNKKSEKPIIGYFINKKTKNLISTKSDSFVSLYFMFLKLSDELPHYIYEYKNLIQPNKIFNNEKYFLEFINNPLDKNNILFQFYKNGLTS